MYAQNSSNKFSETLLSQPQPMEQTQHYPALEFFDILEEIFSYVGTAQEFLQLRLVCQKWNDVIVHSLATVRRHYFPLRLRYGSRIPLYLLQCDAERWTTQILKYPPIPILTGSSGTKTPLPINTVVVERDFYLTSVNEQWQHFLETYGQSIRHLKFNIRSGGKPERNSQHVRDCAQVVSRENLRAVFSAVPNLESLEFSIRFSHYGTEEPRGVSQRMFPEALQITDLPQLKKLTRLTIQEPHGIHYTRAFLREIFGMAPNLTTLYIKWSKYLSTYSDVLSTLPNLDKSLTTLGITMTDRNTRFTEFQIWESGFSRFRLSKLELNSITGTGVYLEDFLQSQSSTLTTLVLGDRVTPDHSVSPFLRVEGVKIVTCYSLSGKHKCSPMSCGPLRLPAKMDSIKILEVNLPKKLAAITSYQNQFPALEELTLSNCEGAGCVWKYKHLQDLLPGVIGQSYTLKKFSLLGQIRDADLSIIILTKMASFPIAEIFLFP